MKFIPAAEFLDRLEKRSRGLKDILLPLFSFIFLRNILEGILEKGHLLGLHPYPYHSFLIIFIHFPLFYLCVFLLIVLTLALFSPKIRSSPKEEFKKIAGSVAKMFWIILSPPIIDFVISWGKGFELSYLLQHGDIINLLLFPFNLAVPITGVSIGMKVEVIIVLVLSFIWVYIKRKNMLLAFVGFYLVYLSILLIGILPLLIATIFSKDFASFYSTGGILYYDTQKFAAVLFILFFVLMTIIQRSFFKDEFKKIYILQPIEILLVLTSLAGFLLGLKFFLAIKPNFLIAQDYFALTVLLLASFLALRIDTSQFKKFVVALGLFATLIISYYTFLSFLTVVILLALSKGYRLILRIIFLVVAFFFTFLAGLSVFTNERAFLSLTQNGSGFYQLKNLWSEEEILIKKIEGWIKNKEWQTLASLFASNPYFVSAPAIVYLEGLYHMGMRDYKRAERFVMGALRLGYKTEKVYLTLGNINYCQQKYTEAIEIYKRLVKTGSVNVEVYKSLAASYFQNNDLVNSIDYYHKAIKLTPHDAALFNNLGVAYLKNRDYLQARTSFIKALSLNPDLVEARNNLLLVESIK